MIDRDPTPSAPLREGVDLQLASLDLPKRLRPYQSEGVLFLATAESALLADEMGLGKTVQAIVAVKLLVIQHPSARVLVVVPKSLKRNWSDEFRLWAPELSVRHVEGNRTNRMASYLLPFPVVITTYEQLRLDIDMLDYEEKFYVVILDEAQRIKNSSSDSAIACYSLPKIRSWALTGTPLENRPADLVSIFTFLKPALISSGMSQSDILERMRPYFLRRRKSEALPDLPPIIDQEIRLEMVGLQRRAYEELWAGRHSCTTGGGLDYAAMLALITRLKQACNHDRHSGESIKLDALLLLTENLRQPTDKVIVFSQYVESLHWLAAHLTGHRVDLYHGGMNEEQRGAVLRRYKSGLGPRILLMSLRAGGVGLNLPETSTVVLFDRWWNPAVENQAIQRAHRFGRPTPLHAVRFLVKDSIETRIHEILVKKDRLFENYVDTARSATLDTVARKQLLQLLR